MVVELDSAGFVSTWQKQWTCGIPPQAKLSLAFETSVMG